MSSENKRRDMEPQDETYDDVYIERVGKGGETERVKVDKVRLQFHSILLAGAQLHGRYSCGVGSKDELNY